MIDILIEAIKRTQNPSVIGLDTDLSYLPDIMMRGVQTPEEAAAAIYEFNISVIDAICDIAPAVKVQAAYYEQYGYYGAKAFANTLKYAKEKGLITIADVKRNDIGSTAAAYSRAYLSGADINGRTYREFECDFITVNGYLGIDGLQPFIDDCKKYQKGIFVLIKTSNPSSGQLQDKKLESGGTVYEEMARIVLDAGKDLTGSYGYSSVGAVVGATYPGQAKQLRAMMPNTFFLVPGYGAQGGTAEGLKVCFDKNGLGAIVNNSRGILCAYKTEKYKNLDFDDAARQAAIDMKNDLTSALG